MLRFNILANFPPCCGLNDENACTWLGWFNLGDLSVNKYFSQTEKLHISSFNMINITLEIHILNIICYESSDYQV